MKDLVELDLVLGGRPSVGHLGVSGRQGGRYRVGRR